MTGLGGNWSPVGARVATWRCSGNTQIFPVFFGQKETSDVVHYTIKIDPSCLFFAYSCFWYSKEVPFVRQVCGCALWKVASSTNWRPQLWKYTYNIILYRHVTISQERFILFPWNLKQNGQETSHNSWLPVVSWTFCHWRSFSSARCREYRSLCQGATPQGGFYFRGAGLNGFIPPTYPK